MLKGLKNLLFGNGGGNEDDADYYYVRLYRMPNRPTDNDEIVEIRISLKSMLSKDPDGRYFARKQITGPRKFSRGELVVYYNSSRKFIDAEVEGGELVDYETYEAYESQFQPAEPETEEPS